jgi:hypothetical protein
MVVLQLLMVPGVGQAARQQPLQVTSRLDRVVVYSTQARVFRRAHVTLGGAALEVALCDLPERVVAGSVQVSSPSATVERVEVRRARGRLPRQVSAAAMLGRLEGVQDRLREVEDQQAVLRWELDFVRGLDLARPPDRGAAARGARPAGLFARTWARILDWSEARIAGAAKRLAQLSRQRRTLQAELHALQVEARGRGLEDHGRPVSRVVARLRGRAGGHRVEVSYRITHASWRPSYDLRYDPQKRTVEASYYALVNQRSGEDWTDARLRFSTGQPTQLLAVPRLATLTLGRRRDFTPTPRARQDPPPQVWAPAAPPPPGVDPAVAHLRHALRLTPASGEDGSRSRHVVVKAPAPAPSSVERRVLARDGRYKDDLDEEEIAGEQEAGEQEVGEPPAPAAPAPEPDVGKAMVRAERAQGGA